MPPSFNLLLLSPEIAVAVLALAIILLDLFISDKRVLAGVGAVGLVVPLFLTIALFGNQGTAFADALVVDTFALLFKLFFIVIAFLVIISSAEYVELRGRNQGEFYALVLIATVGFMLLASTRELISIYIALETTTIPLAALAGSAKNARSAEAGLKYVLIGALSSAILLYGMALLYGLAGTTYLLGIATEMRNLIGVNFAVVLLAMVFLIAGFGFKIAAVPFQMWTPDVYQGSPTPVTMFLSVGSKAAGFAIILRVFYTALSTGPIGQQLPDLSFNWSYIFALLAVLTMIVGNLAALGQTNVKRMLGYSSIAQAGYVLIGLATVGIGGVSGVLFFLAAYIATNLGAFIAVIAISSHVGGDEIEDFRGMGRRAPLLALGLTYCLVSLVGIPPTAGFFGKLYLFSAAVEYGLIWLVLIAVINSAISAYYYIKIVRAMYLTEPAVEGRIHAAWPTGVALGLSSLLVLLIGVLPMPLFAIATQAAQTLVR